MIRHLTTNINGLLSKSDEYLENIFETDGSEVRKELESLKAKGHLLMPSEDCKHFDPKEGCMCRYHLEEAKYLYRFIDEIEQGDEDTDFVGVSFKYYEIVNETDKAYTIKVNGKKKVCKKNAKSTFAYDTKEAAWNNFVERKKSQARHLTLATDKCSKSLELIMNTSVEEVNNLRPAEQIKIDLGKKLNWFGA